MIVTMSPQPYDFHYMEANQTTSAETSRSSLYPSAPDYMSWTTSSYEYPSMSVPSADFQATWSSFTSTSHDDPSMFTSTAGLDWTSYNTLSQSQNSDWSPLVNPSPAVSMPDANIWPSAEYYNASMSPYSGTAVPSDQRTPFRDDSTSDSNNTVGYLSSARIPTSGPSSPTSYQASETASTSPFPLPKSKSASKKKPSEPQTKSNSSKRKATSSSASSVQSSKQQPPLKPSKPKLTTATTKGSTATSEQHYQAQLLAHFGPSIPPLTLEDSKDPRAASERIRREAWRICKAEALEMSQRRVKLLEHEKGALERETQQLQVNIGLMREAINKEQEELREAVGRAERLARSDQ